MIKYRKVFRSPLHIFLVAFYSMSCHFMPQDQVKIDQGLIGYWKLSKWNRLRFYQKMSKFNRGDERKVVPFGGVPKMKILYLACVMEQLPW